MSASYDEPIYATYNVNAATLSSAAELLQIAGPAGKQGRVVDVTCVVTTGVTDAANSITVGTTSDGDAYATLSVPVSSADAVANDATILTDDDNLIAADSAVVVATGGECTAGAGSVAVTIAWF